jgi:glycosyltransferase involved in cell wall biosynthesis
VIASRIGGIADQLTPECGVLLDRPDDLAAFGATVVALLRHPDELEALGRNAQTRAQELFVGDVHLLRYAELFARLLG